MERLDKRLASQGMASRSEVRKQIAAGRVSVNGTVVRRPEQKVSPEDTVALDGVPLLLKSREVLMLYKPPGVVSATRDARDRTVLDLVPPEYRRKDLFPAGRLDRDTTGLMILTDDGALAHDILAPGKHVPKRYAVTIDCPMREEMAAGFAAGVELSDGKTKPADLVITGEHTGEVTLREGRYHEIKRMFGCFGAKVTALHRLSMGGLSLDPGLRPGECRPLTEGEIALLQKRE